MHTMYKIIKKNPDIIDFAAVIACTFICSYIVAGLNVLLFINDPGFALLV